MIAKSLCNLTRRLWSLRTVLALAGFLAVSQTPALAADLIHVEADWSLVVSQPNAGTCSPQVSVQYAPSDNSDYFFQFHINFHDTPSFSAGGLQIEAWQLSTNQLQAWANWDGTACMSTANEKVSWTDSMYIQGNQLYYAVKNGSSQTWGSFSLSPIKFPAAFTNLNQIDPFYVLANSGPTYGADKVISMNPTFARAYYSDGSVLLFPLPPNCYNIAALTANYTK